MKSFSEYLIPASDTDQPQAIVWLSGHEGTLAELQEAAQIAAAEGWRTLAAVDAVGHPLGIVAAGDLGADSALEPIAPEQRDRLPDDIFKILAPLIYECPVGRDKHPYHLLFRQGPTPICRVCRPPMECEKVS